MEVFVIDFAEARRTTRWKERYGYLPALINKFGFKVGAEIGVALGGHCAAILEACPSVQRLYGIDPYQHRDDYDDLMNLPQWEFDRMCKDTFEFMKPHGKRFDLLQGKSLTWAMDWRNWPRRIESRLDFIHIDAEHTYEAVIVDCTLWYEHLRTGGILSGDDYNMPDVARAVQWFARRNKVQVNIEEGVFWWILKGQQ